MRRHWSYALAKYLRHAFYFQFYFQDHCDFLALRNLVLAHHMEDLKETTHKIHYERFRWGVRVYIIILSDPQIWYVISGLTSSERWWEVPGTTGSVSNNATLLRLMCHVCISLLGQWCRYWWWIQEVSEELWPPTEERAEELVSDWHQVQEPRVHPRRAESEEHAQLNQLQVDWALIVTCT